MSQNKTASGAAPADDFRGDDKLLISCIVALLAMDADGSLVPHGVGGHARGLLSAAAARLGAALASREAAQPASPAPSPREQDFHDWFAANYSGDVFFSDPRWHSDKILRQARWVAALAAPVQVAPAGWKLVPVEPTAEMTAACMGNDAGGLVTPAYRRSIYLAMLAAAPMQPGAAADDAQNIADDEVEKFYPELVSDPWVRKVCEAYYSNPKAGHYQRLQSVAEALNKELNSVVVGLSNILADKIKSQGSSNELSGNGQVGV